MTFKCKISNSPTSVEANKPFDSVVTVEGASPGTTIDLILKEGIHQLDKTQALVTSGGLAVATLRASLAGPVHGMTRLATITATAVHGASTALADSHTLEVRS